MRKIYLSKSRFMAGMQCPKRLYLTVHPPEMLEEEETGENLPILNGNIHEATFSYDNILVRVDLLERSDARWILTKVKEPHRSKIIILVMQPCRHGYCRVAGLNWHRFLN